MTTWMAMRPTAARWPKPTASAYTAATISTPTTPSATATQRLRRVSSARRRKPRVTWTTKKSRAPTRAPVAAAMATAFDTAQYFHAGQADPERLRILLSATADNVAQWVLLVPDMSYYFDQPVRRPVGGAIVEVNAAPGFLMNRRLLVVGAQPIDNLVNAFDRAMFGEGTDALVSPALH